jgi:uncharacterized damage-inducible protein DinB
MSSAVYSHISLMNPKFEVKYLFLEKSRNRLLDELESFEDGQLNVIPAPNQWSINQIVAHLIMVDRLTIGYIQNKVKKEQTLKTTFIANFIKNIALKVALKSGLKFKAPQVVASVPEKSSLETLRSQWDGVRFELEDLLTELPSNMMDKYLFKHPSSGPLTTIQALSFLQDHFDHHLQQIRQLKQQFIRY